MHSPIFLNSACPAFPQKGQLFYKTSTPFPSQESNTSPKPIVNTEQKRLRPLKTQISKRGATHLGSCRTSKVEE